MDFNSPSSKVPSKTDPWFILSSLWIGSHGLYIHLIEDTVSEILKGPGEPAETGIKFKSFEEFKKFLEKKDLEIKNKAAQKEKKNEIRKD